MGKSRMFTEQQIKDMKQMRAEGQKLDFIAYKMGCSFSEVWRRTSEYDKRKIKYWSIEDVNKLIELRNQGTSYEEISKILNRTVSACKNKYTLNRS